LSYSLAMARLPDCVKQQIIALRQAGRSWKQICTQLDVKQSTAWNSVAKWKATGSVNNKAPNGRPRKITPRAERKVSMCIHHNQRASLSEIIASYNVDLPFRDRVCSRTVVICYVCIMSQRQCMRISISIVCYVCIMSQRQCMRISSVLRAMCASCLKDSACEYL
jgi:transposase